MLKLAVIGDPIEHSMSPLVHSCVLSQLDIEYSYEKTRVEKGNLKEYIDYAVKKGINGFNITMPHKIDILEHLDYIDKEAQYYASVNTVSIKDGKLYGYNTDALGYIESLKSCGVSIKDKNILILGAGGVVRTLTKAFVKSNAKSLCILNRTIKTAQKIIEDISKAKTSLEFGDLSDSTIKDKCKTADILINATPLGMSGYDGEFQNFDFLDYLKPESIVSDLIYNPPKTRLLSEAENRGLKTLNGMRMLIFQAILADEIYLDTKIDREKIYKKTIELLKNSY